jgi:hypothetical protein
MTLGILRACYVSWLHQDWRGTGVTVPLQSIPNTPSAVCVAPPEDEQVMVETCRGP